MSDLKLDWGCPHCGKVAGGERILYARIVEILFEIGGESMLENVLNYEKSKKAIKDMGLKPFVIKDNDKGE